MKKEVELFRLTKDGVVFFDWDRIMVFAAEVLADKSFQNPNSQEFLIYMLACARIDTMAFEALKQKEDFSDNETNPNLN